MFELAASSPADPTTSLLQYGVLGVVSVLLIGLARVLLRREQARADAEHLENLRLNQVIQDKLIPALISASEAIAVSSQLLQAIRYQQDVAEAAAKQVRGDK